MVPEVIRVQEAATKDGGLDKIREILPVKNPVIILIVLCLCIAACAGQQSGVKKGKGVYHPVKKGETLSQIAQAYQVNPRKLAEVNQLRRPDHLEENSVIFIPDAVRIIDLGKNAATTAGSDRQEKGPARKTGDIKKPQGAAGKKAPKSGGNGKTGAAATGADGRKQAPPSAAKDSSEKNDETSPDASARKGSFVWPVQGRVTARFGRQPNGMVYNHIRITTRDHAQIVAAASGTVIFSAPLRDFGETIIIKHPDDFATVYTHLGSRAVKADTRIEKGAIIGMVGKSEKKGEGYINFEIRQQNKAKNPLLFLP